MNDPSPAAHALPRQTFLRSAMMLWKKHSPYSSLWYAFSFVHSGKASPCDAGRGRAGQGGGGLRQAIGYRNTVALSGLRHTIGQCLRGNHRRLKGDRRRVKGKPRRLDVDVNEKEKGCPLKTPWAQGRDKGWLGLREWVTLQVRGRLRTPPPLLSVKNSGGGGGGVRQLRTVGYAAQAA